MEMADSESSDDASGKSNKQLTDNTRRLKIKLKELHWKLYYCCITHSKYAKSTSVCGNKNNYELKRVYF